MTAGGTIATASDEARSDAQLVTAVRGGDETAFEELYRRYQRRIRRFVARRVRDPGRAEDLTQEAFLSALRGLRASDAEIAWRPWLYEIARNATIDFHRRRRHIEEISMEQEELLPASDRMRLLGAGAPESALAAKQRFEHLRGALDELSARHHRVLVLRELEGLSYREIGERLQLTPGAVESTLFRARRRLQQEFEELAAGRRCVAARATIALVAEGVEPGRGQRRRLARHARRCSACRRRARELGVEPLRRSLRDHAAAWSPLGWLLRRPPEASTGAGETLLPGGGAQLGTGLAERALALLTAGAMAAAGSLSIGGPALKPSELRADAPSAQVKHAPPQAGSEFTGGAAARPRERSAAPQWHRRPAARPPQRGRVAAGARKAAAATLTAPAAAPTASSLPTERATPPPEPPQATVDATAQRLRPTVTDPVSPPAVSVETPTKGSAGVPPPPALPVGQTQLPPIQNVAQGLPG